MAIARTKLETANVALFYDPAYVDTAAVQDAEAYNVKQALEQAGHNVDTFTGVSTSAWRAATGGADVLVIPSPAMSGIIPLSAGAMFFLKDFVSKGGTLVTFMDWQPSMNPDQEANTQLLNLLFDVALDEVGGGASNATGSVAGTTFNGAAAALPSNAGPVEALDDASLPGFAVSLYENAAGDSTVAAFQYGKGQVIWLGWDWFQAAPAPGAQDGGWNNILDRSISTTNFKPNGVIIKLKGKGDDKVKPDAALKTFSSTGRDDVITGNKGDNKIFGGDGHDAINGGAGKDKLHGGEDDDILNGGKNKDQLRGDAGGDYFLFDQKPGGKDADRVKDFTDGIDLILLKQSKFAGLTPGDMSATQFAAHIDYAANGWLKFDGKKFAKLDSGLAISEADFLVA